MADSIELLIKIIGNKYFVLLLGIAMGFAVPPTFAGMKLNPTPVTIIILLMACATCLLAFYKFFNMFMTQRKQGNQQVENKEW